MRRVHDEELGYAVARDVGGADHVNPTMAQPEGRPLGQWLEAPLAPAEHEHGGALAGYALDHDQRRTATLADGRHDGNQVLDDRRPFDDIAEAYGEGVRGDGDHGDRPGLDLVAEGPALVALRAVGDNHGMESRRAIEMAHGNAPVGQRLRVHVRNHARAGGQAGDQDEGSVGRDGEEVIPGLSLEVDGHGKGQPRQRATHVVNAKDPVAPDEETTNGRDGNHFPAPFTERGHRGGSVRARDLAIASEDAELGWGNLEDPESPAGV